jgi:UDP-N-acetyl-D-mannosaminuronic acid transferase (WecB/TagA/CpsF family)
MGMSLLVGTSSTVADWMAGRTRPDNTTVAHVNFYSYWIATRREPASEYDHYTFVFEGIGMKLAAWILGNGWLPDANGTDMYPLLMQHADRMQLRVFLLGGTPGVLEATIQKVRLAYPQVRLCGAHSGYFADAEIPEIIEKIRCSAADLVLISRGSSLHSDFISRCRNALRTVRLCFRPRAACAQMDAERAHRMAVSVTDRTIPKGASSVRCSSMVSDAGCARALGSVLSPCGKESVQLEIEK